MSTLPLFDFAFLFIPTPLGLLILGVTLALGLYAQSRVQSTYSKYVRVRSRSGITGREAAAYVMEAAGIHDVEIVQVPGQLTDHYDPIRKKLALSAANYSGSSLAALGVAAHEAGHAIQHKVGYGAMKLRQTMVPAVNISSQMLPWVMIGGFFFGLGGGLILDIGIACYLVMTIFHLVTLPVEFDASKRATIELGKLGIVRQDEMPGVTATLNAAGFTYVAAFVSSLLNLIYLIILRNQR